MIFREIESFFRITLPSRLAMKDAVTYFSKSTTEVNGPPTNRFVRSMKILKVLSWNKGESNDGTWISSMGKKIITFVFCEQFSGQDNLRRRSVVLFP